MNREWLGEWQRLSPWAMLSLLLMQAAEQGRQHLPLLLGAGAGLTLLDAVGWRELLLAGAAGLFLALLLAWRYYLRFRFRIEEDVLVVHQGLFEHREFKLAARHVQQIAIRQPLHMRPFGVVEWQVVPMAGDAARIILPGIRQSTADALSARLAPAMPAPDTVQPPHYAVTVKGLLLHGLSSRSVIVAAAMLSPLVRPLERWLHDAAPSLALGDWLPNAPLLLAALGTLALFTLLMLLSIIATVWRYFGFRLVDDGGRQIQTRGLLQRQRQSLTLERLQVVEWVETGLGRLLGCGYLICHQFGGAVDEDRRFVVPGIIDGKQRELLPAFWPGVTWPAEWLAVSRYYQRVLLLRGGLLAVLLLAGGGALLGDALTAWQWLLLGGVLMALVVLGAHRRWRCQGWAHSGGYLWVRHGLLGRRTHVFALHKGISVDVRQSWLQRRRGLATLHLHLAHGRVALPFIEHATALLLADELLAACGPSSVVEIPGQVTP
ncbi:putative membrane protein [Franzmannia pantelleriensis]|uniref:Putative membrane protein n=1 Tax=Franzmannia pantelleriensis TaxID=48727 RepID=A0A1G9UHT4_9GAMM|nr:PH domain-containing protein [Halomonas pantelleriensis]SDM59491.1 putative membrane protein [Halomonas pantelleriensis]